MLLLDGLLEVNVHIEALKNCLMKHLEWLDDIITDVDDTTWMRWSTRRSLKFQGNKSLISTKKVPFKLNIPSPRKRKNHVPQSSSLKHWSQQNVQTDYQENSSQSNNHDHPVMKLHIDHAASQSTPVSSETQGVSVPETQSVPPGEYSETDLNSTIASYRKTSDHCEMVEISSNVVSDDPVTVSVSNDSLDLGQFNTAPNALDIQIKSEPIDTDYYIEEYENGSSDQQHEGLYSESVQATNGYGADNAAFMSRVTLSTCSGVNSRNVTQRKSEKKLCKPNKTELNRVIPYDVLNNFPRAQVCLKCQYCNKIYSSKSTYLRHMIIHTGEKPFSCPHCSYRCNRQDNIRKHVLSVHKA